jgi:hypothetical protein
MLLALLLGSRVHYVTDCPVCTFLTHFHGKVTCTLGPNRCNRGGASDRTVEQVDDHHEPRACTGVTA